MQISTRSPTSTPSTPRSTCNRLRDHKKFLRQHAIGRHPRRSERCRTTLEFPRTKNARRQRRPRRLQSPQRPPPRKLHPLVRLRLRRKTNPSRSRPGKLPHQLHQRLLHRPGNRRTRPLPRPSQPPPRRSSLPKHKQPAPRRHHPLGRLQRSRRRYQLLAAAATNRLYRHGLRSKGKRRACHRIKFRHAAISPAKRQLSSSTRPAIVRLTSTETPGGHGLSRAIKPTLESGFSRCGPVSIAATTQQRIFTTHAVCLPPLNMRK